MATRKSFNETAADAPQDTTVKRMRYPCAAHQCPMAGVVFLGNDGVCGYHAREPGNDWPTITQALLDWRCVTVAINACRRVLADPLTCADGKAHRETLAREWEAMIPAVQGSGWKNRLEPQARTNLAGWVWLLECFLLARVKERQSGGGSIDETKPTAYAAEVRAGLRGAPKGNAADNWGE